MTHPEFSPEDRLCLLLAPADIQTGAQERARALLEGPLRWESILEHVMREGIFPLFFRNLRRLGFPGVPDDVRRRLESAFKVNAIRNELLARELARVLKLLGEAEIPAIPLKGVALSEALYGDTSLRVCGDLDILVPRASVARSFQVLLRNRYEAELREEALLRVPLSNAVECELTHSDGRISYRLEIHWGLICGSRNDERAAAAIWLESIPATFFGVTARQLTPEWEFLYLAAHAARHRCEGLKWLADIHDALSLRPLDWERLNYASRRYGWDSLLRLSLGACSSLLGTVVPRQFARSVPRPVLSQSTSSFFLLHPLGEAFFMFRHLKGWRNRISFLLRRMFFPTFRDYSLIHLPHSLGFLYYFFRPFRLGCRGFRLLICRQVRF